MIKSILDITNWHHQRVLVRVDFNVPLDDHGHITDDTRIRECLPTLNYLLEKGARVVVVTHLGRPKGKVVESMRLSSLVERLQDCLAPFPIYYLPEVFSPAVVDAVENLPSGHLLLLENVRFEPGEEKNDPAFAKQLASLADIYVNDAFGTAHRAHASTEGVAHWVPIKVAGLLMKKEIETLGSLLNHPARPATAIIGGSKVSTKITVLENLLTKVDTLIIGGGMLFTFLKAQGLEVGTSLVEPDYLETAAQLLKKAKEKGVSVVLADDVVVTEKFEADAPSQVVSAQAIPSGWMGLDIGPKTVDAIQQVLRQSKTVLWNGPLGVFEFLAFATGTREVAKTLAELTVQGQTKTILGGGDTVAAIESFGIPHTAFTHVSTGGGASLEFLEGKKLPGIEILEEQPTPLEVM